MLRYGLTIFLGAFLLFQIQPIAAKCLLPTFGGVAAVWTTAMLFFQLTLLLGYLYVHLLQRILPIRGVWLVHTVFLLIAGFTLPIHVPTVFAESRPEQIAIPVATNLAAMIGALFLVLAATGPLIQFWQTHSHQNRSPYRLYALSNFGSLAGLLSYPLLVEPMLGLQMQMKAWSVGFVVYAVLCVWSGWQTLKTVAPQITHPERQTDDRMSLLQLGLWLILTMVPAAMLMSATSLLCQEVASFPFLWVLPLTAYLTTFMICFDRPGLYRRRPMVLLLFVTGLASLVLYFLGTYASLIIHALVFPLLCFAVGMVCHGELERSKPAARHLTFFFVIVSLGGLLGSAIVVLLMPRLLTRFFEFHAALIAATIIATLYVVRSEVVQSKRFGWSAGGWLFGGITVVFVSGCSIVLAIAADERNGIIFRGRSEYGLLAVSDNKIFREMINGRTYHGRQFLDEQRRMQPNDYYDRTSGVGVAMQVLSEIRAGDSSPMERKPSRIGVIGLGGGVLTTWTEPGGEIRFYEVNPQVVELANNYFTYLKDSPGKASVVVGDARVQLEQELAESGSNDFDILIVDAFNSDSIPVHLLTRECFQLYWKHLKPDGVLAIHISNRYLDLLPVIADCGGRVDHSVQLFDRRYDEGAEIQCTWVLITANQELLEHELVKKSRTPWPTGIEKIVWTDDFNSVWQLIDWSIWIDWQRIEPGQRGKPAERKR